ncbi:MAG: SDR family NAD(P)-dependent oxidoreductase [Bryobacteraceae bacterium]|nr:SDR family NAD(P)-dependent oxidoreductase [Bryobacteraceae bacterium]
MAERLSARGVEAVVVRAGEEFDGDGVEGVLCLGARDVGVGWGFEEAARAAVEEPLRVLRGRAVPRVVLVHSGAAGAAGLVGVGRVAANEFRDGRVRVVEFPERYGEGDLAGLVEELMGGDGEVESAWRGGERFAPRLVEAQEEAGGAAENCRLQAAGSMDRLEWVAAERRAPGAGEVLIEVEYAAINFRDVLKCVGQYPATRAAELALGDECGGTIVAVGSGVEGWRAGDRVVTCAAGCFRRYVTAPAGTLFRVPEGWETSDAATMPIAFLTAWYALYTVGRLAAGETVLIHAAAGGVGLAAVQLARRAGARILATAGSEAKRDLLRELGCELVMDSRSIAFGREVMEHTGGRGVDVVLNSLAGEALKESVGCLAAYGRFLEIGKRDLFGNSRVGLWPLRNNGSFHAIDLGGVLAERAGTAERLLREVRTALEAGELRPLPMRVWAGSEVREAFRTMSQGKHTGKLLIDVRDPAMEVKGGAAGSGFRGDATYVVTGGLTGFGRETAKWIARRGGRHIALWSRRGPESEEARAAVEELEGLGASAWAVRCDVADRAEVAEAVAAMARDGRPAVRGVFHAAAVIDDAPLAAMEGERLWSVLRAKAQGAWNLHAETSGMELDHFVLFSSVSATVGNPGQANYAAANAMLEGLARCRRESGLAGTAVGWSFVRDTGFAAGRAELVATAARHGFFAARAEEYLKVLEARWGAAAVVAGDFDWERVAGVFPGLGKGLLSGLVNGRGPGEGERRIREALAAAPREERAGMVRAFVLRELGRIVGVGASKIDASRRIADLGVDSLMGIELVSALEDGLPVSVSSAAANPEATVEQLIREVLRQMGYAEAP